tara:strand:+ start:392 stop:577 length:186 start_codon:yes stop_codon:yes gene_type:complete
MNDKIFDRINDEWTDTTVNDFKDWLKTHKQTDDVADRVYLALDHLEEKWKQEKFDSYPDWW